MDPCESENARSVKVGDMQDNDEEINVGKRIKSEEIISKLNLLSQYQPTLPVHFDELNRLWPADPRIPSVISRRAWALARGLNPANVNSWWYRRRKAAKKLRIKIPNDTYELDIELPPPLSMPVMREELSIENASADALNDADEHILEDESMCASFDMHIPSSDDSHTTSDSHMTTLAPSSPVPSEYLSTKIEGDENSAYIQHLQVTEAKLSSFLYVSGTESNYVSSPADIIVSHLSLTSRSPSPSFALFLESDCSFQETDSTTLLCNETGVSDIRADRDALWTSFANLEEFYPGYVLPTVDFGVPLSSCSAQAFISSSLGHAPLTVEDICYADAPWCLAGFRIHFDGSLAGICSCLTPISSRSSV
ncbi:hypothetical protein CVT25_006109 [Psilocybe cyanescens]|uniref:Homeobox domain-containing protein n=1 Tax=Psilocybe cyanescens TaxID=93625 RepID=A0A409XIK7_PSICY|nr:hypothetical protein CVT25_006109 [Psilocybe cyanescens]